jgi:ssDNA-binding replication factor A large subunit
MNAKISKLLKMKEEEVIKKRESIKVACEKLREEKSLITYRSISVLTGIPIKTLENKKYSSYIISLRDEENQSEDKEILRLKAELKHLYSVIEKLHKENHGLKTLLLDEKI